MTAELGVTLIHLFGRDVFKYIVGLLKAGGKPVNHDLQKALRRAYLSALQDIIGQCTRLISGESPRIATSHQGYQWLERKYKQLAEELGQLEKTEPAESQFESLGDIQSLLTPEGLLVEKRAEVKNKLITQALQDAPPALDCYEASVREELFDKVSEQFAGEIKNNPRVFSIFVSQSVVVMMASLVELMSLLKNSVRRPPSVPLTELLEPSAVAARVVVLEGNLQELSLVQLARLLEEAQQRGLRTLRIVASSIVVVVQGFQEDIEQFQQQFQAKRLTEMAGFRILKVYTVAEWEDEKASHTNRPIPRQILIDLFSSAGKAVSFLKQGWEIVWEIVKDSVPRTEAELAFRFRSRSGKKVLGIKKSLDLGKTQVTLTIESPEKTMQEGTERFNLMLVISPTDAQSVLPEGLWIKVFNGPEMFYDEAVKEGVFPLTGCSKGELFSVQLSLNEASVIEHFEV